MEFIFEKKIEDNSTLGYHTESIKADLERWAWGVVYKDGTETHQFDSTFGKFHQFVEINQPEVAIFTMYRTDTEKIEKRIDMVCGENVQYFHFYRNMILENDSRRVRIYVFGWKKDGACSYNYILPDDRLVTSDHDIENLLAFNP